MTRETCLACGESEAGHCPDCGACFDHAYYCERENS